MANELGLPLAEEKTKGLSAVLTFLGIELDTVRQACKLPDTKLWELQGKLNNIAHKRKASLSELQEIVGDLNFACRILASGRTPAPFP